ncbi:MAG: nucleotide exchange factor GrpE [Sandaracinaceae bacterium]|nr:nucleotide exchange factor GrpE [Sandaracinaceae bacterium]
MSDTPTEETGGEGIGAAPLDPTATVEDAAISPLTALEEERDKLKDQLLRTAADFDNFRKRSRKDVEQAERRGREAILRELLPVMDNLERALAASVDASDIGAVREGVKMVLRLFEDTANRIELKRLVSVGERFDPNLHDAFQQVESHEHPPGTVVQEYQPGYLLSDKLLRPAMVVVARKPAAEPVESTLDDEAE